MWFPFHMLYGRIRLRAGRWYQFGIDFKRCKFLPAWKFPWLCLRLLSTKPFWIRENLCTTQVNSNLTSNYATIVKSVHTARSPMFPFLLRWLEVATNPIMLSTLGSGKIVRGLDGIPAEGPVLFVGYHMMLGFELIPLVSRFWTERNILLRGIGHPMMFRRLGEGQLPDLSYYDTLRSMGAVPVSGANLFKLFKSKSHILLYPGGMREALHRKVLLIIV